MEAVNAIQSELHAFLSQRVILASHAGTATGRELERFEHCLDIVTGRRPFVTARPLMLPFPRLPAIPFFERDDYPWVKDVEARSEEHTSELQSLMRISYAVFCLKKKTNARTPQT